ncbi:TetR/AcrR family transcriptional regulator C-terminal domain-containing protein [Clostridium celatum]|uniref:Putative dihydroxyacetone kinase regulator n=1 Tax=Clostridium celatum DSM 1785 TaxID=545697 RepID=L1QME2_9CLOT|nr:TetR/AcrR family transcriptional regulator C-terminal domain-containing protein [Clostridium celatum]EKY29111.1 putative dihydroxyacetone kinase regulator [Clostridium celatum DSM 1785]MCE9654335.1 TetR/AcrR family transcriptional regulator C-terminal domain-containing protein [Clostridium celatum]
MNNKKEDVHLALIESFKKLILKQSFDKITIKMITDGAGLIRPTFYNHFADKYEVLEEICYEDLFKGSEMLIENRMPYEAIQYMFSRIENNKEFYEQAIKVTGQNSFEEIINNNLIHMFKVLLKQYDKNSNSQEKFSVDDIAEYYSRGLTFIIKRWIEDGINISAKDLTKKYEILVTNSLDDIIHNLIK